MITIPISNVGSVGIVNDLPFNRLPLHVWTDGRNVRFRDGAVEKFQGHAEVFATPAWAPYWMLPVQRGGGYFWLYTSATKAGATDGSSHTDITRTSGGDYNTDLTIGWTGTLIEDIPVVNNGSDVPQMWSPPSLSTPLAALTGWNSGWRCNTMRSLKRYLVALDVTKSATRYSNMIKWSHEAPTGGVPTSWDETDETLDAGEWTLSGEGGFLVDGFPLRDVLVLYKEYQTWLMTYVGGLDVFRFTKKFDTIGALSRRCAIEFFEGKQVVFTGDDIVLHDGQQAKSLLKDRSLTLILGTIDSSYYQRSFVTANYPKFEVWCCFPEIGNSLATKALVWNWQKDTIGVRDLPSVSFIGSGIVSPSADTWAAAVGDWSTDTTVWGDRSFDPSKRHLLMGLPGSTKFMQGDQTQQFNGVSMTSYVERQGIGYPIKSDGPPDYTNFKQIIDIYPHITGTDGGVVNVYLAPLQRINDTPSYGVARPFTIGSSFNVDFSDLPSAPLHSIKFESTADIQWKLDGYDITLVNRGRFG